MDKRLKRAAGWAFAELTQSPFSRRQLLVSARRGGVQHAPPVGFCRQHPHGLLRPPNAVAMALKPEPGEQGNEEPLSSTTRLPAWLLSATE